MFTVTTSINTSLPWLIFLNQPGLEKETVNHYYVFTGIKSFYWDVIAIIGKRMQKKS